MLQDPRNSSTFMIRVSHSYILAIQEIQLLVKERFLVGFQDNFFTTMIYTCTSSFPSFLIIYNNENIYDIFFVHIKNNSS